MTAHFTHHGGRLAQACTRFGGAPGDWLDLSTGINPNGWTTPNALEVDWRRLPDPEAVAELEAVAARHFGCETAFCVAVPGSETALRLLAGMSDLPGMYRLPCYGTYRAAFAQSESLADFDALPARATVLTIGNPNNPDGITPSRARLLALLDHQERHGGWLIVDEAFADCTPAASIVADVGEDRRLIVLRSLGKFFGLAGVRLGFVIGPRETRDRLRLMLGDWPLHSAAIELGTAAYNDQAWIAQARRDIAERAARLDAVLARHGLHARGDCPLFRLIGAARAEDLFERLAHQHVLTRPFAGSPNLLRIGLPGNRQSLDRLDRALG